MSPTIQSLVLTPTRREFPFSGEVKCWCVLMHKIVLCPTKTVIRRTVQLWLFVYWVDGHRQQVANYIDRRDGPAVPLADPEDIT